MLRSKILFHTIAGEVEPKYRRPILFGFASVPSVIRSLISFTWAGSLGLK